MYINEINKINTLIVLICLIISEIHYIDNKNSDAEIKSLMTRNITPKLTLIIDTTIYDTAMLAD